VGLEAIKLLKRTRVEQEANPLARSQLSRLVLALDPSLAAPEIRPGMQLFQLLYLLVDRQGKTSLCS
jgi:hypothetical protein